MEKPQFVYETYIRTTPDKVWQAVTQPQFTRQYWGGYANVSSWKKGSRWEHLGDEGDKTPRVVGEVVESAPPHRLVLTWASPEALEDKSTVTLEIEAIEDMVRLRVTHGGFIQNSVMLGKVTMGWPRVLCSLKSFLETGRGLDVWAGKEGGCGSKTESARAA